MHAKSLTLFHTALCAAGFFFLFQGSGFAQETTMSNEAVDTLNGKIETVKSDLDLLKRFKVTGYMQAQWQLADTAGSVTPFSGGAFPGTTDNRYAVRRGRIKFAYDNEFSTFVLQLDATEKGVGLKDAYITVKEPWLQVVTLTTGVFNRPFGYEIVYSSSNRETPERSRIFQTLFPQERDLGSMITLSPKKGTKYEWIKLDAGLFAGNGINPEFDKRKDFIGHLYFAKANRSETIKYGAGISLYNGGVFQGTKKIWTMGTVDSLNTKGFVVDSTGTNKNKFAKRQYIGFDAQLGIQSVIGFTQIRAEYLMGTQPGTSSSNVSIASASAPAAADTYIRKFTGGYVYFIQSIGQTKHQLVVKYDWLDPNTKISGADIKAKGFKKTGLGLADVKYTTIGFGWNYRFNSQVKFMAYYEIVKNENTSMPLFSTDAAGKTTYVNGTTNSTKDLKDNVLTLRVQYKF